LAEYLLPMAEAFQRFMPEVQNIGARTMIPTLDKFQAGVVEGDVAISEQGLVYTTEMVPAFADASLGALFITGSVLAPKATIAEVDADWSPLLKIKGNVVAKNLCLGGSASEIDGDVTVEGLLMGYYNHGEMRIRGKTSAELILIDDYQLIFDGPVTRKYVAGWVARTNIPIDYDHERLDLILVPEVLDETNFVHDYAILDRLKRGLPILRPEGEIGTPPPVRISEKAAARLAELVARKQRGEEISQLNFFECELRYVPDQLREFSGARELVLSDNRVKSFPAWIGDFEGLETLGAKDCGLATLPVEIARLPRLRNLNLGNNPLTSLPFGPENFRKVEILTIGEGFLDGSPDFTTNLDLSKFPWLRVIEQRYDINTIDELTYRDSHDLWDNPHLDILNIGWPALKKGIPAGLLKARNLRALASRVNVAQLGSFMVRGQHFERLEYLAIGYNDLTRVQLARLYDALPRVFISTENIDGKNEFDLGASQRLWDVEHDLERRQFDKALAALDEMAASINLRRPFWPTKLHAHLMTLSVKVRRIAAEEEQDRSRREAMAAAALTWADRMLSVLPENAESLWYLDYHQFWLVRLECLYVRATGLSLRAAPDAPGANIALDLAQAELDRFLLPVNPSWHASETAVVKKLRVRIPA
jgi:hypothetical protein